MEVLIILLALLVLIVGLSMRFRKKEGYRDPLWLNQQKYEEDYYPKTRGDIYDCGDMFSGYNSYPKAY